MPYDWTTDARILAAGNARGLRGGNPDRSMMTTAPRGPRNESLPWPDPTLVPQPRPSRENLFRRFMQAWRS